MKERGVLSMLKSIYGLILENKIVTVCILFTFITVLESSMIILGVIQAKVGLGPYVHMLGRFVLNSIIVGSVYIFELLKMRIKSKLVVYISTYFATLSLLLMYLLLNSLFVDLHPDAYIDGSISYTFMFMIIGIVFFIGNTAKKKIVKGQ